jgi:group I intron endonuclease
LEPRAQPNKNKGLGPINPRFGGGFIFFLVCLFTRNEKQSNVSRVEIAMGQGMDYTGKAVIYKIINLINAKFYVGSTIKWDSRLRTHRRKLRAGAHHCVPLQNSWNKHGEDSFVFRVILVVDDPSELHQVEQQFLDKHHGTPQCYNLARYTNNSSRGAIIPERKKKRISEGLKRYYAENPELHPRFNKPHTEETKAKMRQNRAGIPMSEETKAKLREVNLGKRASDETRAKLSAMRKGKERTKEHAEKYNKAVLEVTSGRVFPSLKAVKEEYGMSPGSLATALQRDEPIAKGKNAGKHFRYV